MPSASPVFVYLADLRPAGPRWCVLRAAIPGGRITTLCADAVDYAAVAGKTSPASRLVRDVLKAVDDGVITADQVRQTVRAALGEKRYAELVAQLGGAP